MSDPVKKLTDRQIAIGKAVVAAVAGEMASDVLPVFVSIMARCINDTADPDYAAQLWALKLIKTARLGRAGELRTIGLTVQ